MSEIEKEKYTAIKKTDWIIIIVLLLLPLLIKVVYSFGTREEFHYQIKHYKSNNEIVEDIECDVTKSIVIHGKIGDMLLEFDKEKGVRVASSTCPCQVCVNYGWTKNETLVCVPNAVLIQPVFSKSKSSLDQVDAVSR